MEYNNTFNKPYCGISQPIPPAPPGSSGYFPANDTTPTFLKVPNPTYIKQEVGTVSGESVIHGGTVTPPVNYSQHQHYGVANYAESGDTEKPLFYRKTFEMPYLQNPYLQPQLHQYAQHPHPLHPNHHNQQQQQQQPTPPPHHHNHQLPHIPTISHLQQIHHQQPPLTVPSDMHSPQQLGSDHLQRPQQQQQQQEQQQQQQQPSFHEYFDHLDPSSMEPYAYVLQKPLPPPAPPLQPQPIQSSETPSPMPTSFPVETTSPSVAPSPYEAREPMGEKVRFKCETCPKTFDTRVKLDKHNRTHAATGGAQAEFKCRMCDKTFRTKSTLICHEKVHGENGTFNQKCQLQYHEKLQEEHTIACDHCEKVFCYKASHKEHMFKVHFPRPKKEHQKRTNDHPQSDGDGKTGGGDGPPGNAIATSAGNGNHGRNKFKCTVCDRRFYYKRALEMHMGVHDASLDVNVLHFSCNYCPDTFTQEESLQKHEAQHVADGTTDFLQNMKALEQSEQSDGGFRCPLCFKRYDDQQALREHHKTHLCALPDCGKCTAAQSDLFDLTRSTYNESEDMQATACNVCHRVLPTFEAYQNHFHYHTARPNKLHHHGEVFHHQEADRPQERRAERSAESSNLHKEIVTGVALCMCDNYLSLTTIYDNGGSVRANDLNRANHNGRHVRVKIRPRVGKNLGGVVDQCEASGKLIKRYQHQADEQSLTC
uniref:C2H2-type domain-containing protein n=1 Tax=Anopheles epiroticus TaxID=199890 RepID=A0A182P8A3_9DIPT